MSHWSRKKKKLGVALLGLGNYATNRLAPALQATTHCELIGIVTGSPEKIPVWKEKYGISDDHVYSYDTFDSIKNDDAIDIVYVVTPNALHKEFVERAAAAGKHVICEKPMEISSQRCRDMIEACKKAGVLLQIGYRCKYDPYHQELIRLGREEVLGKIKLVESSFSFYGVHGDNWRFTDASLSGGGPLMDIGVYCIQGCRYATGLEPISVTAQTFKTIPDKMPGMEETISWQLEFPDQIMSNSTSSYVARNNQIRVSTEKGWYELSPAYGYATPHLFIQDDQKYFPEHIQQASQMDAFGLNIKDNTPVLADGEEGWKDMVIVESIYKAAQTGNKEKILF